MQEYLILFHMCYFAQKLYRVRHQNPDKLNNFFEQNFMNEKLNIRKNPFTWHLGDPYRT